jgi:hypothetical protein
MLAAGDSAAAFDVDRDAMSLTAATANVLADVYVRPLETARPHGN